MATLCLRFCDHTDLDRRTLLAGAICRSRQNMGLRRPCDDYTDAGRLVRHQSVPRKA
ncbi:MAG: hypothetical protein ACLR0N_03250 [Bilophila wadsworthia]